MGDGFVIIVAKVYASVFKERDAYSSACPIWVYYAVGGTAALLLLAFRNGGSLSGEHSY